MSIATPTPRLSAAAFKRKPEIPDNSGIETLEAKALLLQRDPLKVPFDVHTPLP